MDRAVPDSNAIVIKCKDLRVWRFESKADKKSIADLADSIEKLLELDDVTRSFPFHYLINFRPLEDGWNAFPVESEFAQCVARPDAGWRVSYANHQFQLCKSYPQAVVVPAAISDDVLAASASFRQGGRFPVLAYRHANGRVLVRTSQPLSGVNQRRSRDDEKIFAAILNASSFDDDANSSIFHQFVSSMTSNGTSADPQRGFIIDTRTTATAQTERVKGGGFEDEYYYPKWRIINKSIDRYYYLLGSYSKLMEACSDSEASTEQWLSKLAVSSWLTHIKEVLNCGCLVAQLLDKESASVVVHGSEGVDITLCVTALAQIILNPDCRTIRGFEALLEREWIQAGHPFWSRTKKGAFSDSVAAKSRIHAPTFILFLDCVRQIHAQFPASFEFSEKLLIFLADHAYASDFGTFLCDCEMEREALKVAENTTSLWAFLNRPELLGRFSNFAFNPNRGVIWPSVAPISIDLWTGMYLRWSRDVAREEKAEAKARDVFKRNREAKANIIKMRAKLKELTKEAVEKGLLAENEQDEDVFKEEDEEAEFKESSRENNSAFVAI